MPLMKKYNGYCSFKPLKLERNDSCDVSSTKLDCSLLICLNFAQYIRTKAIPMYSNMHLQERRLILDLLRGRLNRHVHRSLHIMNTRKRLCYRDSMLQLLRKDSDSKLLIFDHCSVRHGNKQDRRVDFHWSFYCQWTKHTHTHTTAHMDTRNKKTRIRNSIVACCSCSSFIQRAKLIEPSDTLSLACTSNSPKMDRSVLDRLHDLTLKKRFIRSGRRIIPSIRRTTGGLAKARFIYRERLALQESSKTNERWTSFASDGNIDQCFQIGREPSSWCLEWQRRAVDSSRLTIDRRRRR